ncbi:MAG: DinB family protein [Gemmatimonadales bacterium]
MSADESLRSHIAKLLGWEDAHVSFDKAVADLDLELCGTAPARLPYSPWQLVEHLRITQADILDFCVNSAYEELKWPDDYWPAGAAPPSRQAWDASIASYRRDRDALKALALNGEVRLEEPIPHGSGQTYLRELLLAADHAAYHVGELVVVRRLLGAWPR